MFSFLIVRKVALLFFLNLKHQEGTGQKILRGARADARYMLLPHRGGRLPKSATATLVKYEPTSAMSDYDYRKTIGAGNKQSIGTIVKIATWRPSPIELMWIQEKAIIDAEQGLATVAGRSRPSSRVRMAARSKLSISSSQRRKCGMMCCGSGPSTRGYEMLTQTKIPPLTLSNPWWGMTRQISSGSGSTPTRNARTCSTVARPALAKPASCLWPRSSTFTTLTTGH